MRGEICSRRNAAAVAAGEEDMMKILPAPAPVAAVQRGKALTPVAAATAAPQPLLLAQAVRFDPVPVFVGPKPGWTGPVLAARETAPATPSDATAYTTASVPASSGAPAADAAPSAPLALMGAVKPPPPPSAKPPQLKKMAKWVHPPHKWGRPKLKKTNAD
jgi:hypothetical protein